MSLLRKRHACDAAARGPGTRACARECAEEASLSMRAGRAFRADAVARAIQSVKLTGRTRLPETTVARSLRGRGAQKTKCRSSENVTLAMRPRALSKPAQHTSFVRLGDAKTQNQIQRLALRTNYHRLPRPPPGIEAPHSCAVLRRAVCAKSFSGAARAKSAVCPTMSTATPGIFSRALDAYVDTCVSALSPVPPCPR